VGVSHRVTLPPTATYYWIGGGCLFYRNTTQLAGVFRELRMGRFITCSSTSVAIETNVLVCCIDGPWLILAGEDSVGPIVVAIDLLDRAGDDRRRRVAEELLASV
jgi:hypothetical protein